MRFCVPCFPGANGGDMGKLYGGAAWVGVLLLLAFWAVCAWALGQPVLLPSPWSVLLRWFSDLSESGFWVAIAHTALEAFLGALLGAAVALPLAYVVYRSRFLSAAFGPILAVSQSVPAVALAPLLVIWVGYGVFAISLLCALIVFFPILITTVLGLRGLPVEVLEAARLDGAGGWSLLRFVEAPMALPSVLAGFRAGFTLSVTGAVVGEYVMGGRGLGARLSLQSAAADMPGLFSSVLTLCALAALIYGLLSRVERSSRALRVSGRD